MSKLYFEDVVDVSTPHPYVFVYMLGDDDTFSPSAFAPFTDLAAGHNHSLLLTVFESTRPVSLTMHQWMEIARVAKEYHKEILDGDLAG